MINATRKENYRVIRLQQGWFLHMYGKFVYFIKNYKKMDKKGV